MSTEPTKAQVRGWISSSGMLPTSYLHGSINSKLLGMPPSSTIRSTLHCRGRVFDSCYRFAKPFCLNQDITNTREIAVNQKESMEAILVGLEQVVIPLVRCAIYEKLYLGPALSIAEQLKIVLKEL